MLITNFNKNEKSIFEKALKEYKAKTKDNSVYIDPNAYVQGGRKDEGMCALRSSKTNDMSYFWQIFRELE
jgi:hypothetical protein